MKERDVRGCEREREREKECVCVCVTEGAIVPKRHSRAIFHLARQPRTAISATAAGLNLRARGWTKTQIEGDGQMKRARVRKIEERESKRKMGLCFE